jgi:Spy/CpxP family protein refolding chaperone
MNLIKLLPGAVLAATLTGVPMMPAFAQVPTLLAEAHPALDLKLTAAQKTQLKEIQNTTHAEMQKLLTPEQLSQLEAAKSKGQSFRKALAAIKLTSEQKAKVNELKKQGRVKEDAVLTDEQRQKMQAANAKPGS